MANRYLDWYSQALEDFEHARKSLKMGDYEWVCFAVHQAVEKLLKAVLLKQGVVGWGHTVSDLLDMVLEEGLISEEVYKELFDYARMIDKYYIPTRYPNGFDSGYPAKFYSRSEAEQALEIAEKFFNIFSKMVSHADS